MGINHRKKCRIARSTFLIPINLLGNPIGFKYALLSDLESNPLPFKDDTFDSVTCLEVIEHLASPDNLIFEIARVLKSNGRMILSTPNLASWSNRAALLLGYFPISMSISAQSEIVGKEDLFDRKQKSAADAKFDYHVRAYIASVLKIILQLSNFRISRIKIVYGYKSKDFTLY